MDEDGGDKKGTSLQRRKALHNLRAHVPYLGQNVSVSRPFYGLKG